MKQLKIINMKLYMNPYWFSLSMLSLIVVIFNTTSLITILAGFSYLSLGYAFLFGNKHLSEGEK